MDSRRWQRVGAGELKYDKSGEYKVPLRVRNCITEASAEVTVQVGEERGSPWFSSRVGDV